MEKKSLMPETGGLEKKSLMPKYDMADALLGEELRLWSKDLEGKTFKSLDELKKECPEAELLEEGATMHGKRRFEEYVTYAYDEIREGKAVEKKLAYKCPNCGDIIGGPPKFRKENSMGKMPLAGRIALDYHCSKCHRYLDNVTFMCS